VGDSQTAAGDAEKTMPVGTRVPLEDFNAIEALRPLYPESDGKDATRSAVLRAFIALAMPAIGDLTLHRRLQALARRLRRSAGEVMRDALVRGLDALEGGAR